MSTMKMTMTPEWEAWATLNCVPHLDRSEREAMARRLARAFEEEAAASAMRQAFRPLLASYAGVLDDSDPFVIAARAAIA